MIEEPKKDDAEQITDDLTEAFRKDSLLEGYQSLEDITDDSNDDTTTDPESI